MFWFGVCKKQFAVTLVCYLNRLFFWEGVIYEMTFCFYSLRDLLPNIVFWFASDLNQIAELRLVNKNTRKAVDETFRISDKRFGTDHLVSTKPLFPLKSVWMKADSCDDISQHIAVLQMPSLRKYVSLAPLGPKVLTFTDLFGKLEYINIAVNGQHGTIDSCVFLRSCKTLIIHIIFGYLHFITTNENVECKLESVKLYHVTFENPKWVLQSKKLHTMTFESADSYWCFVSELNLRTDLCINVHSYPPYIGERFQCSSLTCNWPLRLCASQFQIDHGLSCSYFQEETDIASLLPNIKSLALSIDNDYYLFSINQHYNLEKLTLTGATTAVEELLLCNLPRLQKLTTVPFRRMRLCNLPKLSSFSITNDCEILEELVISPSQITKLSLTNCSEQTCAKFFHLFPNIVDLALNRCRLSPSQITLFYKVANLRVYQTKMPSCIGFPVCEKLEIAALNCDELKSCVPNNVHYLKALSMRLQDFDGQESVDFDFLPSIRFLQNLKLINVKKLRIPTKKLCISTFLQIDCQNSFVEFY